VASAAFVSAATLPLQDARQCAVRDWHKVSYSGLLVVCLFFFCGTPQQFNNNHTKTNIKHKTNNKQQALLQAVPMSTTPTTPMQSRFTS
jgi:hypothetical protein